MNLKLRLRPAAMLLLMLPACARWRGSESAGPAAPPEKDRFDRIVVAEGFNEPMELDFLPDGRVVTVERPGLVKLINPATKAVAEAAKLEVFADMENGLLGVAADPKFSKNRWLYLFYSPKDAVENRVSRFVLGEDGKLDLASEKIVLRIPTQRDECCHQAGALEFGPGGNLFISTGDNTNPFASDGFSPSDYRKDRSAWDAAKSSANTNDLRGKILRIHPEPDGTYSIPEGNLFAPGDPKAKPEVYVMGCRNPFRIGVDPESGFLYWGEVGPDSGKDSDRGPRGHDEINQARAAGNFGWPYFVGDNKPYAAFDFAESKIGPLFDPAAPVNASPNNTGHPILPPAQPAFIWYPYAKTDVFPAVGEGGRTACAGPVYHYDERLESDVKLPRHFDNHLFIHEWERGWIKAVKLEPDGSLGGIEDFMPDFKFRRPVNIKVGPMGDLYLLEYGTNWGANDDAKLVRLQYRSANRRPAARLTADRMVGAVPLKVRFSAAESADKDGDAVSFAWDFGDGSPAQTGGPEIEHVFLKPGKFKIRLTVSDPAGETDEAFAEAAAGNDPPSIRIVEPVPGPGFHFEPGKTLAYRLERSDREDDDEIQREQLLSEPFLSASPLLRRAKKGENGLYAGEPDPPGLAMMKASNCFNCHAVDRKVVGPAFKDIADRYAGADGRVLDEIIGRVTKGSTGVWGDVQMLPHENHSADEIKKMVEWVLGLKKSAASAYVSAGVEGKLPLPPSAVAHDGMLLLTASVTDHGAEGADRLTSQTQILVRSRRIGAEHYDHNEGIEIGNCGDVWGGQMGEFIDHGDRLGFDGLNLEGATGVTYRLSSAGAGGFIEFRLDAPDGPLLATTPIPITGGWNKWTNVEQSFVSPGGVRSVYLVFVKPDPPQGGLVNINWFELETGRK